MMSDYGLKNILGIIVGVILIASNVLTYIDREELITKGLETTAIVTGIRNVSSKRYSPSVYVNYAIDGITYHNRLKLKYERTYIGEEVTILYNPNKPNNITPKDRGKATDNTGSLIARCAMGVIIILLSISLGRSNAKKAKRNLYR